MEMVRRVERHYCSRQDLAKLPVDEQGQLNPANIGRTMAAYDTDVIR